MTGTLPQPRYRFVPYGGTVEELDRLAIRDRIRSGDIEGHTELALLGSEEWRPAAAYPELARYFELAAARPRASGQYVVAPSKPRAVQSMGDRLVRGLLYPIDGGQILTLLGISLLGILPFVGWLASAAAAVIMLDVIRKSADGSTRMPSMVDTSNLGELVRLYVRVLLVTLISLAPAIAAIVFMIMTRPNAVMMMMVMAAAAAFAAIYYPACLATVAVWDNVISALHPGYVFRVISRIGADYFIVIGVWFLATLGTFVLRFTTFSVISWIPIVGSVVNSMLSLWVLFYASHLLGYAVYRHAPELGWE